MPYVKPPLNTGKFLESNTPFSSTAEFEEYYQSPKVQWKHTELGRKGKLYIGSGEDFSMEMAQQCHT